jgi:hypothetical protein
MRDVELDVTATLLTLKAPGFADVLESLPVAVRFEDATAKFIRKTHTVMVTIPIAE